MLTAKAALQQSLNEENASISVELSKIENKIKDMTLNGNTALTYYVVSINKNQTNNVARILRSYGYTVEHRYIPAEDYTCSSSNILYIDWSKPTEIE